MSITQIFGMGVYASGNDYDYGKGHHKGYRHGRHHHGGHHDRYRHHRHGHRDCWYGYRY